MRKNQTRHLVKTNPNKANLHFTAENAGYAKRKDICISDCLIKKYALYPISPRSLRTRRLMKNKANFKPALAGFQRPCSCLGQRDKKQLLPSRFGL